MIRLIVDSTFGIQKHYAEKHNIKIVRLKMILGEEVFDEGFEDTYDEFYEKMKTSKHFPTTSQPSPQDFMDAIDEIYAEDENAEVIILTISNALSGTINSATIAANSYEGKKIVAIDTREATTCCRMMTEEIVEAINAGKTFDEILELIKILQQKLQIDFIPDTMDALKRGGRIGGLTATVANILKIKPIFRFADGKIRVIKKVLGFSKAISDAVAEIPKKLKKLYVCYIHDNSNVQKIIDKIKNVIGITNIETVPIEPVFGVHVGIAAVGIASLEQY